MLSLYSHIILTLFYLNLLSYGFFLTVFWLYSCNLSFFFLCLALILCAVRWFGVWVVTFLLAGGFIPDSRPAGGAAEHHWLPGHQHPRVSTYPWHHFIKSQVYFFKTAIIILNYLFQPHHLQHAPDVNEGYLHISL